MRKLLAFLLLAVILVTGCTRRIEQLPEGDSISEAPLEPVSEIEEDRFVPEDEEPPGEDASQDAEEYVRGFLDAAGTGLRERIAEYADYDTLLRLEDDMDDTSMRTILRHMQYEITSVSAEGETAVVTAAIRSPDMNTILPVYFEKAMEMEYNNAGVRPPEEMEAEYARLLDDLLLSGAKSEYTVKIPVTRNGEAHSITISDTLQTALLGDYFTATANMGVNAGGGMG